MYLTRSAYLAILLIAGYQFENLANKTDVEGQLNQSKKLINAFYSYEDQQKPFYNRYKMKRSYGLVGYILQRVNKLPICNG